MKNGLAGWLNPQCSKSSWQHCRKKLLEYCPEPTTQVELHLLALHGRQVGDGWASEKLGLSLDLWARSGTVILFQPDCEGDGKGRTQRAELAYLYIWSHQLRENPYYSR